MPLFRHPYKRHAIYLRSEEKALQRSRRLVQSAKMRVRRPFHPELFERPAANVIVAQPPKPYLGQINPSDEESIPTVFSQTLERPQLPPVQPERIAHFEPELADVPPEYARDALACMGVRMMNAFQHCRIRNPLLVASQREIKLVVTDHGLSCLPTHVLALHPPADPTAPLPSPIWTNLPFGREVVLLPVHAVVLAANCGRLPEQWPESRPRPPSVIPFGSGETAYAYNVPLLPFCVPHPNDFETLVRYMYDHNKDILLNCLTRIRAKLEADGNSLPPLYTPNPALVKGVARKQSLYHVASECILAHRARLLSLYEQIQFVQGFWKNAVALGVSDDAVWEVMQLAWEGLVLAMKWVRGAQVHIAKYDAQRAAAAAREGIELLRENTEATAARNKRMIEEYVRAQLNNKQEDTL